MHHHGFMSPMAPWMTNQAQALAQAQASLGIDFDNLRSDGSDYERLLALDDRIEKKGLSARQREELTLTQTLGPEDAKWHAQRGDRCAICLGDYEEGESVRVLPCLCRFHTACVDHHFDTSIKCPVCQAEMTTAHASS